MLSVSAAVVQHTSAQLPPVHVLFSRWLVSLSILKLLLRNWQSKCYCWCCRGWWALGHSFRCLQSISSPSTILSKGQHLCNVFAVVVAAQRWPPYLVVIRGGRAGGRWWWWWWPPPPPPPPPRSDLLLLLPLLPYYGTGITIIICWLAGLVTVCKWHTWHCAHLNGA